MEFINSCARVRSPRWLIPILCLLTAIAPNPAQSQSKGSSANRRDTLPEYVALQALAAYDRHDVRALQGFFDTVSVHEMLGDSTAKASAAPEQMWSGIADYFAKTNPHVVLKQHIVSGPLVVLYYEFIANGKRSPHIEVDEVRHGKIVHVWDQP
jgi:hypothetical protein